MRAILLAAGLGSRLRPLTDHTPKCLVPINDRPLLDYWLKMLEKDGITEVLVNLHYLHKKVEQFISQADFSGTITTCFEPELLGTCGTLIENRAFFKKEPFLFVHADNLSEFDLKAFIKAHERRPAHCDITMMTFVTDTPQSCGIVELDSNGVVKDFHEKVANPPGNLANGAVFIMEYSVIEHIENQKNKLFDFCADVLPMYVGKIFTFHNDQYHRDIGTMESFQKANEDFS